jgi:chromosome segregation ATPase
MNWLREHMRDHIATPSSADPSRNVLKFTSAVPEPPANNASSALDLVAEAAEVIKSIERRAIESETRAKSLAESAIEKLHHADSRIQASDEARRAGEENLAKVNARLQEVEKELTHTKSRLANADAQFAGAEQRAKNFELRAIKAEKAVKDVESAIRLQLMGLTKDLNRRASADAA